MYAVFVYNGGKLVTKAAFPTYRAALLYAAKAEREGRGVTEIKHQEAL